MKLPKTNRKCLAKYCWVHPNTALDRAKERYEPRPHHKKKIITYYRCNVEDFMAFIEREEEQLKKPHNNI